MDSCGPKWASDAGIHYAAQDFSVLRDADQDNINLEKCILLAQERRAAGNSRTEHGLLPPYRARVVLLCR